MAKAIIAIAEDGTESAYGPYYTFNTIHRAWYALLLNGWSEDDLREITLQKIVTEPLRHKKDKNE